MLQQFICVKSHLSAAMAVMDAKEHMEQLQHENIKKVHNPPPNACHQKQFSFFFYKAKTEKKQVEDGVNLHLMRCQMHYLS